jgi:hypothetical protein
MMLMRERAFSGEGARSALAQGISNGARSMMVVINEAFPLGCCDQPGIMPAILRRFSAVHTSRHSALTLANPRKLN